MDRNGIRVTARRASFEPYAVRWDEIYGITRVYDPGEDRPVDLLVLQVGSGARPEMKIVPWDSPAFGGLLELLRAFPRTAVEPEKVMAPMQRLWPFEDGGGAMPFGADPAVAAFMNSAEFDGLTRAADQATRSEATGSAATVTLWNSTVVVTIALVALAGIAVAVRAGR
jgi:hypothetical protein